MVSDNWLIEINQSQDSTDVTTMPRNCLSLRLILIDFGKAKVTSMDVDSLHNEVLKIDERDDTKQLAFVGGGGADGFHNPDVASGHLWSYQVSGGSYVACMLTWWCYILLTLIELLIGRLLRHLHLHAPLAVP